jgi:arginyl-tRNA synthetase
MTIKDDIENLVRNALAEAQKSDLLPSVKVGDISIDRPQQAGHGDFASSLPLKLAKPMRMNPMLIAEKIESLIPTEGIVESVSIAAPGFINFSLKQSWLAEQVDVIREAGDSFGNVDVGKGLRVQIEFVSANPVGPLHVAHARGGVIGSALANILEAGGYNVDREYYFNDAGAQIIHFKRSLFARYQQEFGREVKVPEDGYHADYMVDLAREIKEEEGDRLLNLPEEQAQDEIGPIGLDKMMARIREDVKLLRIDFDNWFNEATLYKEGQFDKAMQLLRDEDYITEEDGAVWFASTKLGDEKDKVMVRSNGIPTYFASDVAYHYNKFFERKYDKVINIWGADHQGHAAFLKALIGALGLPPEKMTLIINQLVTLKRGGEVVRISKRTGDMISLRDVIEEVGADPCRFFFLSRDANSQMDFDMDLAREQSQENPVYYVQYAHARISSILRLAEERTIDFSGGDLSLLTHDAELALIRKMLELPELIEMITHSLEPHHLPHYSTELATAFHKFYDQCRVVSEKAEDQAMNKARLKLADATRIALARCLSLMIMDAPVQM